MLFNLKGLGLSNDLAAIVLFGLEVINFNKISLIYDILKEDLYEVFSSKYAVVSF